MENSSLQQNPVEINPTNPESAPSNTNLKTGLKALIIIFVIILIAAISFAVGRNYFKNKKIDEIKKINTQTLEEDQKAMDEFSKDSSEVNQKKYIDKVNSELERDDLYLSTINLLLLRKALALSVVRGSESSGEYRDQATDIFRNFILSTSTDSGSQYLRDFSIAGFIHLHTQCCATRPFVEEIPVISTQYKALGYDDKVARLFTFINLANSVSGERSDDIAIVSLSLLAKAQLLDTYGNVLKEKEHQQIITELDRDLAKYSQLKPKTLKDPFTADIEPSLYYAYAKDQYLSSKTLTEIENGEIDSAYETAFEKLKGAEEAKYDQIGIDLMRVYNASRYIRSMDRRYGENEINKRRDSLVEEIVNLASKSPEVKKVLDSYFVTNFKSGSINNNMGYLLHLAKMNNTLKEYVKSIGIDPAKIK